MRYYPHYFFFPSCYSYYYRFVHLSDHEAVHLLRFTLVTIIVTDSYSCPVLVHFKVHKAVHLKSPQSSHYGSL